MQAHSNGSISGHVYLKHGRRGAVWYYRARLPRELRKRLGPAWSGNGRPPAGYFTKKTAQAALGAILTDARRGTLAGTVATGSTFADASAAWLAHAKQNGKRRPIKPSTAYDYACVLRHHLDPVFGPMRLEAITPREIERWQSDLLASGSSRRTINKATTILHGVFEYAQNAPGTRQPDGERRQVRRNVRRGTLRLLLARRSLGARPCRHIGAGRRALPHRRIHTPTPRRVDRAPCSGCGL